MWRVISLMDTQVFSTPPGEHECTTEINSPNKTGPQAIEIHAPFTLTFCTKCFFAVVRSAILSQCMVLRFLLYSLPFLDVLFYAVLFEALHAPAPRAVFENALTESGFLGLARDLDLLALPFTTHTGLMSLFHEHASNLTKR